MPARAVRNVVMSESIGKELVYWTHRHVLLRPLMLSTDDADGLSDTSLAIFFFADELRGAWREWVRRLTTLGDVSRRGVKLRA